MEVKGETVNVEAVAADEDILVLGRGCAAHTRGKGLGV